MPTDGRALVSSRQRRLAHALRRWRHTWTGGDRELPRYSVVGAKRAGTSSLNEYITQHPHAFHGFVEKGCRYYDVNYHRGPRWFERQLPPRAYVDRLEQELGVRPVFGESSPYYSFHPHAAERMARDLPDLRLLFLLRDPVQRAWSHYRYEVARGYEDLSFAEALRSEPGRLSQPDPVRRGFSHQHHSYVARGQYGAALTRLLRSYPRESVLVLDSADLFARPAETMAQVLGHVGLAPLALERYPVVKGLGDSPLPDDAADLLRTAFVEDAEELRSHGVVTSFT